MVHVSWSAAAAGQSGELCRQVADTATVVSVRVAFPLWAFPQARDGNFHHVFTFSKMNPSLIGKPLKNKPYDEVLVAAQFTERTMHQCQKLS